MYIKHITISNFGAFGENVEIDVPIRNEPILIIGENRDQDNQSSNGASKSMFMYAVLWCFTGTPPPRFMSDDVIREGESSCHVAITLADKDKEIKIHRSRSRTSQSLHFYVNGKLLNKKTETATDVQKTINEYFGLMGTQKEAANDFYYTNFLTYKSVEMFVTKDLEGKKKFELISRMFNLDRWMKYKEVNNEILKERKRKLINLENEISDIQKRIQNIDYDYLLHKQSEYTEVITDIQAEIEVIKEELNKTKKESENREHLNMLINKLKGKKEDYIRQIKLVKQDLIDNLEELDAQGGINSLREKLNQVEKDIKKNETKLKKLDILNEKYQKLQIEKSKYEDTIKECKRIIKDIESNKTAECPECHTPLIIDGINLKKTNLEEMKKVITDNKNKIKRYEQKISKILKDIFSINQEKDNLQKVQNTNKQLESLKNTLERRIDTSERLKERIDKNYTTMNNIREEYKSSMEKLIKQIREAKKKVTNIKPKYTNDDLTNATNKLIDFNRDLENVKYKINDYEKQTQKLEHLNKERQSITSLIKMGNYWNNAFVEIRRRMIQSIIPSIERETNKYLELLGTSFAVSVTTLKETKTSKTIKPEFVINVYDKADGTTKPVDMRSTGERKRIGIATCFALQDIKTAELRNSLDFKFTDEVVDNIDSDGLKEFFRCISKLKSQIFVISHNNDLQSRFRNTLKIIKENGVSTIWTQ